MKDVETLLDADEARAFAGTVADVSIAPLGRNYFNRYREVRDAVKALASEAGEGVDEELLRQHLDADDLEFLALIVRNLENFAEEGLRRQGEVEPYTSARSHVQRLRPFVEDLEPHFDVDLEKEDLAP